MVFIVEAFLAIATIYVLYKIAGKTNLVVLGSIMVIMALLLPAQIKALLLIAFAGYVVFRLWTSVEPSNNKD